MACMRADNFPFLEDTSGSFRLERLVAKLTRPRQLRLSHRTANMKVAQSISCITRQNNRLIREHEHDYDTPGGSREECLINISSISSLAHSDFDDAAAKHKVRY